MSRPFQILDSWHKIMSLKIDNANRKRKSSPVDDKSPDTNTRFEYVKVSSKHSMFTIPPKNIYGHTRASLDSDSSEEVKYVVDRRALEKLRTKHKAELKEKDKVIKEHEYTIKILQATCRQYNTKVKKIRRLAEAAVNREECIFEYSNAKVEEAAMRGDESDINVLASDPEDYLEQNRVKYDCNEDDDNRF